MDHPDRISTVVALGLDATVLAGICRFRAQQSSTQIIEHRRVDHNRWPPRTAKADLIRSECATIWTDKRPRAEWRSNH